MRGVHINTLSYRTEVAAPPLRTALAFIFCLLLSLSYTYGMLYGMPCHASYGMLCHGMVCFGLLRFCCWFCFWFPCVPFCSVLVLLLSVFVTLIRKMQHAWQCSRVCGGRVANSACNCGECVPSALLGLTWHTCPHLAYLLPFSTAKAIFMIFLSPSPSPSPFFLLFFSFLWLFEKCFQFFASVDKR